MKCKLWNVNHEMQIMKGKLWNVAPLATAKKLP